MVICLLLLLLCVYCTANVQLQECNKCFFFSEQANRQTWYLCSLTRWAKRFANARSTSWRSWAKNAQTSCCSTSARQMKPGRRQTDRSVYLICIIYFCFKESWTCEMNFFFSHQRVMMQIVQELCRRPGLNKCGFEMPTIYIPNPQKVKWTVRFCVGYFKLLGLYKN